MTNWDLINSCLIALREAGGYIYGFAGTRWTEELQARYELVRDTTKAYGRRWLGRRVWDCSGLISWACKLYGIEVFHGSDTIWRKYLSNKGTIDENTQLRPGTCVFLYDAKKKNRHHIGVYVGQELTDAYGNKGTVIEARATRYGVVVSQLSRWDEWGELSQLDFVEGALDEMGTLRMGSQGDEVKTLQESLRMLGYDCGKADGIYGKATRMAVEELQDDHGLVADGVCGPLTQAAIRKAMGAEQPVSDADQRVKLQRVISMLEEAITQIKGMIGGEG